MIRVYKYKDSYWLKVKELSAFLDITTPIFCKGYAPTMRTDEGIEIHALQDVIDKLEKLVEGGYMQHRFLPWKRERAKALYNYLKDFDIKKDNELVCVNDK